MTEFKVLVLKEIRTAIDGTKKVKLIFLFFIFIYFTIQLIQIENFMKPESYYFLWLQLHNQLHDLLIFNCFWRVFLLTLNSQDNAYFIHIGRQVGHRNNFHTLRQRQDYCTRFKFNQMCNKLSIFPYWKVSVILP